MTTHRRLIGIGILAIVGPACASFGHSPAVYRGTTAPPVRQAFEVGESPYLLEGSVRVGEVRARCTLSESRARIDDEWLSDVDCTEWRLTEALRQAASENGGELLVDKTCERTTRLGRNPVLGCEADVARTEGRPTALPVPSLRSQSLDDPSGAEAWRIRVNFEPLQEPVRRAPRRADAVDEVAVAPVAAESLGVVSAVCAKAPCSLPAVRAALRVAAGRLGATHVAQVSCVDIDESPRCQGEVALLDERLSSHEAASR